MQQNALHRERLHTIRLAIAELHGRKDLSGQAKERGLKALKAAYEREKGSRERAI